MTTIEQLIQLQKQMDCKLEQLLSETNKKNKISYDILVLKQDSLQLRLLLENLKHERGETQ